MVSTRQRRGFSPLQPVGCDKLTSVRAGPAHDFLSLPAACCPTPRAHGFTLLEMLAVILLIGIAAAAVSVSVSQGLASARVRAASTEMAAALRATRAQAIVRGEPQTFDVDIRAASYRGAAPHEVRVPQGMQLAITSARQDQPNGHTGRIRFFPDGSSTGGHITLQRGQRKWQVNVSWLTGAVSVLAQ